MNNDELKKKICDIVAPYVSAYGDDEAIANALIAVGMGDVKEEKFESDHYWRMWQGSLVELERAEHRAEVYERALYHTAISGTEYQEAIEQAEKELGKEGKND